MSKKEQIPPFNLVGSVYGLQAMSSYIPSGLAAGTYGVNEEVILSMINEYEMPVYKMPEQSVFLNPNCFMAVGKILQKPYKEPFTYADLISGKCPRCRRFDLCQDDE